MSELKPTYIIKDVDVTDFCSASACAEFVVWDFGHGDCYSCKLVGQSHRVDDVPSNCIKLNELQEWIATNEVRE